MLVKTNKRYIITWIIMVCFLAGQYMVYAHQHKLLGNKVYSKTHKQTVKEKCELCDVMHHNVMEAIGHASFLPPNVQNYFFKEANYAFLSIALILSDGRSPPSCHSIV